jgi:hypothetical protein
VLAAVLDRPVVDVVADDVPAAWEGLLVELLVELLLPHPPARAAVASSPAARTVRSQVGLNDVLPVLMT